MRRLSAMLLALIGAAAPVLPATAAGLAYPAAPRGAVTDTFFGTSVADPYRWMEELDSPQTTAWTQAENQLARGYLDAVPQRTTIRDRYRALLDYARTGPPGRHGKYYAHAANSGLQNQYVIYVREGENGADRVLLDPNALASDGTVALSGSAWPVDGRYYAYSTSASGSDWQTWHVRDVASGRDLPDVVEWSKFSGASWRGDDGFYYSRYDAPAGGKVLAAVGAQRVMYHKLGTPQSADRLIMRAEDPNWFLSAGVTYDQRYFIAYANRGTAHETRVWIADLQHGDDSALHPLFANFDAQYGAIGNDGSRFYFNVQSKAIPRGEVVWIDVNDPALTPHVIVPQQDQPLDDVSLLGNTLFAGYLQDAHSRVERYDLSGKDLGPLAVPGIGSMGVPYGRREDRIAYYTYSSYVTPVSVYRYDALTGTSTLFDRWKAAVDPDQFETQQVFYRSKDGTRIPMFIVHKRGLKLTGDAPTILYGYGGFDIALTPGFDPAIALWAQMGGVYAIANLRGGSEYGEAWHDAGRLEKKQNVFDDFIGAAQFLIDKKITSAKRLAISGASNGGLLVAATLVQRPELFGAALPDVGVLDMLRFQKFTAGKAWTVEYGSADATAEQFKTLYAYSPLHNVKPDVAYPPTLIRTADHDDRVYPAHSFKFAATLQAAQAGPAPILLAVESKAGHGGGRPISKHIEDVADEFAFLVKSLDFTPSL